MTIRRSAGLATILLSVLGFLVCMAGAAGVWKAKRRVDAVSTALFGAGDEAFAFLESKLERAKKTIAKSREQAGGLSALAERLKNTQADASAEFASLRQTIDEMYARLQSAEHWLDSTEAVARGVNRASQALAESQAAASSEGGDDGGAPSAVTAQRIAEFSTSVTDAVAKLQVMRQELLALRDNGTLAREAAARIITRVAELDAKLADVCTRIDAFNAKVSTVRTSCTELGRSVRFWLIVSAVVLTLLILWFGVSQIAMMKTGWGLARRPTPPMQ